MKHLILPILDERACADTAAAVHAARRSWVPRQAEPCRFFTLGRASYLDDIDRSWPEYDYLTQAARDNALLRDRFGALHDAVLDALRRRLGPCRLTDSYALPGFHIFLAHGIPKDDAASVHFDLQYQRLGLSPKEVSEIEHTLSFTLPIRLPRAGGGLNVWSITHQEYVAAKREGKVDAVKEMARDELKAHVPYKIGEMVVHGGAILHQITGVASIEADDERISLQGHGMRRNGVWELYW